MSSTPALNGQVIGQAHHATRALLERVLDRAGLTFHQSVALNAATGGDDLDRDGLVDRMSHTLKLDRGLAEQVVTDLTGAGLLTTPTSGAPALRPTAAGRQVQDDIRAAVAGITDRLYGGLPTEDLAAAARVLGTVTERANAELAGA
ncbi:hypothetical protein V6U90_27800 [Micromonospora sp. CPCC 206060]|uniref:hypothetical protein n=1 Tax=Micromonospora sp. CPCC 206060 TaxID=3122406 RepID=UPI002FF42E16